jgi:large subunit ribosomal protein L1
VAHGKRYRQQYDKVDRDRAYPPAEAIALVKATASTKFDETVEAHILLGVNVRHADEQLRGTLALPHGLGKDVTIAVFAQGQQARDAEAAGADFVDDDDLAKKVEEGWTDFDVAISTPDMMPAVGKLGRVLGPQGKMPNPKVGTVTDDIEKAVGESKSGKVEYRTDRQAIVHMAIGKAGFDASQLLDNFTTVLDEIVRAKPASAKGKYIISCTLATTMGPGIRVDASKAGDRELVGVTAAAAGEGDDGEAAETAAEPATA